MKVEQRVPLCLDVWAMGTLCFMLNHRVSKGVSQSLPHESAVETVSILIPVFIPPHLSVVQRALACILNGLMSFLEGYIQGNYL